MTELHATDAGTRAFVVRHQTLLWRWLRALGCDRHEAEEHCQDALLAALHHGIDRRPAGEQATWLRTAARNLFWMQLRKRRRLPAAQTLEGIEAEWTRLAGDDDGGDAALRALDQCLQQLPPRERALVEQRYAQRQSRAAMAQANGLGEAGIKMALRRLRTRLRACIERRLGGDRR